MKVSSALPHEIASPYSRSRIQPRQRRAELATSELPHVAPNLSSFEPAALHHLRCYGGHLPWASPEA